jgi:hypothetical protein
MRAGSPETPRMGGSPASRIHVATRRVVFDRAVELPLSPRPRLVSTFL